MRGVGSPAHPVLIVNPRSGDGKAERVGLARTCADRGINVVMLEPGADLVALAEHAVTSGADAIGMAGGDGSQGLVAGIAAAHDLPFVCIPSGTRNHFAIDLGIDPYDVVGALDAFGHERERRIDLGRVNGRVFVNNASLGVYAQAIKSRRYRAAKAETFTAALADTVGRGRMFPLDFTAPDGAHWSSAQLVMIANNPYRVPRPGAHGGRDALDGGVLGVLAARMLRPDQVATLVASDARGSVPRSPGWLEFTTPHLEIDAPGPVDIALDGEALVLDPPLQFESQPRALRVRTLG